MSAYVREAYRLTDRDLVRAAQAGDEHALDALLRALADELLPLASALAGASADADVLVGDTLSRVYERLTDLRGLRIDDNYGFMTRLHRRVAAGASDHVNESLGR